MMKTNKQSVVNDFLPNPNWRQSRFCFWIDETRWAKMRQFGLPSIDVEFANCDAVPLDPSTPLPAHGVTKGTWIDFVPRGKKSVVRTVASNTSLSCFPRPCYLFLFVGAAPTASCDSQMIAMTLEPARAYVLLTLMMFVDSHGQCL